MYYNIITLTTIIFLAAFIGFVSGMLVSSIRINGTVWAGQLKIFYTKEEEKPIITAEFSISPDEIAKRKQVMLDICAINLDSNENRTL